MLWQQSVIKEVQMQWFEYCIPAYNYTNNFASQTADDQRQSSIWLILEGIWNLKKHLLFYSSKYSDLTPEMSVLHSFLPLHRYFLDHQDSNAAIPISEEAQKTNIVGRPSTTCMMIYVCQPWLFLAAGKNLEQISSKRRAFQRLLHTRSVYSPHAWHIC